MKMGKRHWSIPGGQIPLSGEDAISILNTTEEEANIHLTIYYQLKDPVTGYEIKVSPKRKMVVRCNDLIDPEAIVLEQEYALVIESDVPVVIQFFRQDTGHSTLSISGMIPYFE